MVEQYKKTNKTLLIIFTCFLGAFIIFYLRNKKEYVPPPNAPGYFSGYFRPKGNPNILVNDEGKVISAPLPKPKPISEKDKIKEQDKNQGADKSKGDSPVSSQKNSDAKSSS